MTIVKRLVKGSELTHAELDGNFEHLLAALSDKADAGHTHSAAALKTINGETLHGSGDIELPTEQQITVSTTAPASPTLNQLWLDIS